MLTDGEGAVSDTYDYDAFGTATASTGLTVNPYRYCGEYQDETTGLYYLRARYYDSTTGRFISADSYPGSTADPVSLHKYLYANANPVMNSDPTGNKTLKEMVGALAANSIIQRIATSSMVGGLMSMLDTLLGADEVDPLELIESYRNGAVSGIVSGLFTMGITSFGNINCITSIISKLTMGGISAYFSAEGFKGAIESFGEGKYIQGIFRLIGAGMSARSAANEFGGAMKGANAVANGAKCFVAGTIVLTEDGEKPIEDIEVSDYVYSTDPETGESDYKEVLNVFIRQSNIIIHIFVNGEEIETTPTHPFWVEDEWVPADKLKAGDILTLADGTTAPVTYTYGEQLDEPVIVYNFEVSDFHTYYVTDTGVLVHNMDKFGCEIRSYKSKGRMSDDLLLDKRKPNNKNAINITEWRRKIHKNDIAIERIKFVGVDAVKIDKGTWRSLDGTRQFRTVPADYFGGHEIGRPKVPHVPHVHFEFLGMPNPGGSKLRVLKNIHVPLI